MRRYGQKIAGQSYRTRPGAYAVIVGEKGLLITYQGDPHYEFQLPGGGIDPGETPIQALHREVREETGWRIEIQQKLSTYQRFTYMFEYEFYAQKICHIFLARAGRDLKTPLEDGHEVFWMSPEQAVEKIGSEGDAEIVARLFNIAI